jgi:predicted phage terminase large subunit-like protein
VGQPLAEYDDGLTDQERDEYLLLLESVEQEEYASEIEKSRNNERLALQADFALFVKAAWPILEPGTKLSWSWHYDLMCEHLTLAAEKKTKRLIINIPPRTLKSTLITVMFPVWVWTRSPNQSFLCSSYAGMLSEEHSVKRRRLIESDWFIRLWSDRIWLQKDQNQKSNFQNNFQAKMFATSVGGTATGMGGNFLIVDDGLKPDEVASEPVITALHSWFDNTWQSRLNNRAEDVMIIVEQRTGELDLSGHCLDSDKILVSGGGEPQWTHLCIPLEADAEAVDAKTLMQRFVYPISKRVKERPLGDVLQPDRFPPAIVASMKVLRLVWATQYQGRPSPLEGNMIKRSEVMYYGGKDPETGENDRDLPTSFDLVLTSVDAAFKDVKTADFVCVMTIGVKAPNRYILDIVTKHLDAPATEKEANRQRLQYKSSVVLIEDKANGPAIIKSMRRTVSGVVAIEPEGGKITRMYASCGSWQSLNWYVARNAAWSEPFIEHLTKFPGIKNDDDVDAMTQAEGYIQRNTFVYGLTEYVKQEEEKIMAKIKARANKAIPANLTSQDNPTDVAKIDVDDKTLRCPNELPNGTVCNNTFIQRTPSGLRCGSCGYQFPRNVAALPKVTDFGAFRK